MTGPREPHFDVNRRTFNVCRTFNEIMTGPNPLTKEQIRRMIEKRPEVYGVLRAWA